MLILEGHSVKDLAATFANISGARSSKFIKQMPQADAKGMPVGFNPRQTR
jgi:hypothetical protein